MCHRTGVTTIWSSQPEASAVAAPEPLTSTEAIRVVLIVISPGGTLPSEDVISIVRWYGSSVSLHGPGTKQCTPPGAGTTTTSAAQSAHVECLALPTRSTKDRVPRNVEYASDVVVPEISIDTELTDSVSV